MPRILLEHAALGTNKVHGETARYLTKVLRLGPGEGLFVFDGKGNCFGAELIKTSLREAEVLIKELLPTETESPLKLVLFQGILKSEKMDIVIQKTTELGISGIVPVFTDRCEVRHTRKVLRWRKIALEASRQSGRSKVPEVAEPLDFKTAAGQNPGGIIFREEGGPPLSDSFERLKPGATAVSVFIGPEGGFTKEEVSFAEQTGLLAATLGRRTLRAETAAISAVCLLQFSLGDMGKP